MCSKQVVVPTWYMKHVFKDFRGRWRCLSFAKHRRKKQLYKSRVEVAKSNLSLKHDSARRAQAETAGADSRNREASNVHSRCRWMFKTFSVLHYSSNNNNNYSQGEKRFKFTKIKNSACFRMKHFICMNPSFESRETAVSLSSSSMNELISSTDVDLESELVEDLTLISTGDDSDIISAGAPPNRRSSASFYYPPTLDTAFAAESSRYKNNLPSPYQSAKHQRRKSATVVRQVKNSSTSNGGVRGQHSNFRSHYHHVPFVNDAAALAARVSSTRNERTRDHSRRRLSPDAASVSAIVTMDTASSSPTNWSISTRGWLDVYDLKTENLSSWAPREEANSAVDVQTYTPTQGSFSGPFPRGGRPSRRDFHHHGPNHHPHHRKTGSVQSFSQRHPSIASSVADNNDRPRRSVSSIGSHYNHHHHQCHHLNHPLPAPRSVNTQKDFQEAIVDIILENDVNDLVDLEEFLQGYFGLNTLYQEIIQQFFNDLSNDLVNPHVSRAPTVFARLASHSTKCQSSFSRAKDLAKTNSRMKSM